MSKCSLARYRRCVPPRSLPSLGLGERSRGTLLSDKTDRLRIIMSDKLDLPRLQQTLRRFAAERDWEQFHSPKNLVMALSVEAAELVEIFQWLTEAQSTDLDERTLAAVAEEIADVQIYLARLADRVGIDIPKAVEEKLVLNARKYPANDRHDR